MFLYKLTFSSIGIQSIVLKHIKDHSKLTNTSLNTSRFLHSCLPSFHEFTPLPGFRPLPGHWVSQGSIPSNVGSFCTFSLIPYSSLFLPSVLVPSCRSFPGWIAPIPMFLILLHGNFLFWFLHVICMVILSVRHQLIDLYYDNLGPHKYKTYNLLCLYIHCHVSLISMHVPCRPITQSPAVQPAPATNPFGTLPAMPHMSISRPGAAPSIQYGISSMPVNWTCFYLLKFEWI